MPIRHIVAGEPVIKRMGSHPIYISDEDSQSRAGNSRHGQDWSNFGAGYRELLRTELTNRGYIVTMKREGALVANTITEVVPWSQSPNEVIVTTSVTTDSQFLFRKSTIFYINGGDSDTFARNPPPAAPTVMVRTMPLVAN
jgi:hypothetical protein